MQSNESLKTKVGVAVEEPWARTFVERSIKSESATAVPVHHQRLFVSSEPSYSALIYDLHPWTSDSAIGVKRLIVNNPGFPILLYVPPTAKALAVANDIVAPGQYRIQIQVRERQGLKSFKRDLRSVLGGLPLSKVMLLLESACPNIAGWAHLFIHHVLRTLSVGRRPTASATARAVGVSVRTLERRLSSESLPTPKQFVDWLTLLLVAVMAEQKQMSLARAAQNVGLTSNDLYRLRCRLLGRDIVCSKSDVLSMATLAFAAVINGRQEKEKRAIDTS